MPHPEHAVDPLTGSTDGLRLFESAALRAGLDRRAGAGPAVGTAAAAPVTVPLRPKAWSRDAAADRRRRPAAILPAPCESESAPSGSTAGRASSPASSARPSTSSGTRRSSSAGRRRRASRCRRRRGRTTSGRRRASPRPPTSSSPSDELRRLGRARPASTPASSTRTTSSTRSRRCAASGVRTIGRFVWERFSDEHVEPTQRGLRPRLLDDPGRAGALRGDGDRGALRPVGRPPRVRRDHPEPRPTTPVDFHYHAGLLGKRKPFKEVINAFSATDEPELRLIVKAQIERRMKFLERAVKKDPRVELVLEDLPTDEHLQMFADADVCMAPARWEGLGLHLYEAIAFGQPIVCNDDPPMNELVIDGVNGLLVPSHPDGLANSGIPAKTVDVDGLTDGDLAARRPGPAGRALRRRARDPRGAELGADRPRRRRAARPDAAPRRPPAARRSRLSLGAARRPAAAATTSRRPSYRAPAPATRDALRLQRGVRGGDRRDRAARAAGADFVRRRLSWAEIERDAGRVRLEPLRRDLRRAARPRACGRSGCWSTRPAGRACPTRPASIPGPPARPTSSTPPTSAPSLAEVAERYPESLGIEIGNEVNDERFWAGGAEPERLRRRCSAPAADAIHAADPEMPVVASGFAPFEKAGPGRLPWRDFVARRSSTPAPTSRSTRFAFHPYPPANAPTSAPAVERSMAAFEDYVAAKGVERRPGLGDRGRGDARSGRRAHAGASRRPS